jgi:hypothetical protein
MPSDLRGGLIRLNNVAIGSYDMRDIGLNKAIALVRNLQGECTCGTILSGYAMSLETAIHQDIDLTCDVAICGVDNNSARVTAAQYFRKRSIPVIIMAVSADAEHG